MRIVCLAALVLAASGCSFSSSSDPVRAGRVVSTVVEALPLATVWDRDLFGPNGPDVYVEVRRIDTAATGGSVSAFRTVSENNVEQASLPLSLSERAPLFSSESAPILVDERVVVVVYDDDTGLNENDLMFASDTLRVASYVRSAAEAGDEALVTVEGDGARVRLRLRWE